jgi:hypothetical protein
MPLLDVNEVLTDADLADTFTVVRRAEMVNTFGEMTVTETRNEGVVGVIVPGSERLQRDDDFQSLTKTIEIATPFRLQGPSPGFQPDIIEWGGSRFVITVVDDLTHFGAGHVQASAVSMTYLDPPPGQGS